MEKTKKMLLHPAHEKKEGRWLSPAEAAPYFRNGKGLKLPALMYNLRTGKLDDVAYRDAFGWHIFIPMHIIEQKALSAYEAFQLKKYGNVLPPDTTGMMAPNITDAEKAAAWFEMQAEQQLFHDQTNF